MKKLSAWLKSDPDTSAMKIFMIWLPCVIVGLTIGLVLGRFTDVRSPLPINSGVAGFILLAGLVINAIGWPLLIWRERRKLNDQGREKKA